MVLTQHGGGHTHSPPPAERGARGGRHACERVQHYPLEVSVNLFSPRDRSPALDRLHRDLSAAAVAISDGSGPRRVGLVRGRSGTSDGPATPMSRQVTRAAEPASPAGATPASTKESSCNGGGAGGGARWPVESAGDAAEHEPRARAEHAEHEPRARAAAGADEHEPRARAAAAAGASRHEPHLDAPASDAAPAGDSPVAPPFSPPARL